jgi:MYXO-CTERM domain-containing protein
MAVAVLLSAAACPASTIVNYTVNAGGNNYNPLNGLTAQAMWRADGTNLTIVLTNTSTGVPFGAEVSDSLLVSLAFDLGDGISITSGVHAIIGTGSTGLGAWSGLLEGDSVAEQWLWTNDGGGDLLESFANVISTSNGQGGGNTFSFNGDADPIVSGPFGGIAADPPLLAVPVTQQAVSNSIEFSLTLNTALTLPQLEAIAGASIVEFGSDYQYLSVPAPGAMPMLVIGALASSRRRRK